jgi:Fungal Zn(2)-Cys(6) binuclear cluster domain
MTNIQPRHRIGKEAAEARILGPEPQSRLIHLSLACDQCRKTKSKCERSKSDDDPCKSCLVAGTGTCPPFSLSYPHHQLNPLHSPSLHFPRYPPLSPTPPIPSPLTVRRTGPSFKRGPPKGYIHAIEQRWHQVESILGAILSSKDPHVNALINNLRRDDLARDILGRVDLGPFVSISRHSPSLPSDIRPMLCRAPQVASVSQQECQKKTFLHP